jgi:hypothetical protein
MALRVCPSCSRHARDVTCPFCGADIPQVAPIVSVPRVSRTALLGFAATAAVVGACSTSAPLPAYGIAILDVENDVKNDAFAADASLYGGPPFDASTLDADAGSDASGD